MKKALALLCAVALIFSLTVGCKKPKKNKKKKPKNKIEKKDNKAAPKNAPAKNKK